MVLANGSACHTFASLYSYINICLFKFWTIPFNYPVSAYIEYSSINWELFFLSLQKFFKTAFAPPITFLMKWHIFHLTKKDAI